MKHFLPLIYFILIQFIISAQPTNKWGDQGNGTFLNPILPADYSDPDVIRVGKDYYLIASTFQLSPGNVIMHSKDLVNWQTIGYATPDIAKITENLNYTKMNNYSRGFYAASIRFHNDTFYLHFTTLSEGIFVCKSKKITGPWTTEQMKDMYGKPLKCSWFDDPCPLWDDDGNAYFVSSKLKSGWIPRLFKMSQNGTQILDACNDSLNLGGIRKSLDGTVYCDKKTAEGNKLYKINGIYYFFHNEVTKPEGYRTAIFHKSKYFYGTKSDGSAGTAQEPGKYDEIKFLRNALNSDLEPNQGGLIDTPDGKWYFITHQGKGSPWGRPMSLLPIEWKEGWPKVIKRDTGDVGNLIWEPIKKPVQGYTFKAPQGSDNFESSNLGYQWQWNYQPKPNSYSLVEKKGYLRMYAYKPIQPDTFFKAGNTLCQRYFKSDSVVATVKIDFDKTENGQVFGLAHFNGGVNYSSLGVVKKSGQSILRYENDKKFYYLDTLSNKTQTIWLQTKVDSKYKSYFLYSLDGNKFTPIEGIYNLSWGKYRGDYIGIFNYNNETETGYVDVDWFDYKFSH